MSVSNYFILIPILIVIIAFLYSAVGHGGASGHIAVLTLMGIAPIYIKSSALILNVLVSSIAFISYYRGGYFKPRLLLPFLITSIPFSFLGGLITTINPAIFQKILGIILIFPILRLLGVGKQDNTINKKINMPLALIIGAVIGFLSGMMGIGGGILLTPVLILLCWANLKEAAAVSALFILLNSISGLIALSIKGISLNSEIISWIVAALIGAYLGSYFGARKFNFKTLRYCLAIVLCIASFKLLIG
ncbi:MAG TPA: sulfite exporter TauE/SafE family protein [Saprospiraceae bacterium]|nr:sulfite exporter TauE/SafE family protein [Saprospiraceae bacterium]